MKNESKILIIEDDMLLNDMTKRLLTQHGYCATSAYSGSEALLLIERSSFDLILLDLMLPGIPGEIVLEKIKNIIDIPIIGVSAKTDIDSKVNLIRNGADDYITKPFDNQELLVRIEAVLRHRIIVTITAFFMLGVLYLYLTKISTALDMDYSLYKYWVVGLSHSLQINTFGEDLIPICLTLVVYLFLPTAISLSLFLRLDLRNLERR